MVDSEEVMAIALRRGILAPSAEIYGPTAGFYDYGDVGAKLKRKIEASWRAFFVQSAGMQEVDTAIIGPEHVFKASGHLEHFMDPIVECSQCRKRYRADHLVEEQTKLALEGKSCAEYDAVIKEHNVRCPSCNGKLKEVAHFNMMFKTQIGPVEGVTGYLRPETAQGMFVNFPRVFRSAGSKLPMGIAQTGRAFRNEISPRQGLVRVREFNQMEIEWFFNPQEVFQLSTADSKQPIRIFTAAQQLAGTHEVTETTAGKALNDGLIKNATMAYFLAKEWQWYSGLGIPAESMRMREQLPEQRAHYSAETFDFEVLTSLGWIEVAGTAYRTDFDLRNHQEKSGQDMSVLIGGTDEKIMPHVIEPSFGLDRTLWAVLEVCFRKTSKEKEWDWFAFPAVIAPYDVAVLPLMKKPELVAKAQAVLQLLRAASLDVRWDETASIGKRYARADEIGVPYCLTIDFDSLTRDDVTVRDRDSGKQVRVPLEKLVHGLERLRKGAPLTEIGSPLK